MPAETHRDDARALADGVLAWFVRDPRRRAALADSCLAWVADHPDEVGDFDLAWLAARAVATGHEHSDEHPPAGDAWVGELMDASVGVRVAVALHHVGGFGVAETARLTRRDHDSTATLIGRIAPPPRSALAALGAPPPAHPVRPAPEPAEPGRSRRPGSRRPGSRRPGSGRRSGLVFWLGAALVAAALVTFGAVASRDRHVPQRSPSSIPRLEPPEVALRSARSPGCENTDDPAQIAATTMSLRISGLDRSVRLVGGTAEAGAPRPLLLDFGDAGTSVDEHVGATRLDAIAQPGGLVVATLAPLGDPPQWNVGATREDPDDVGAAFEVIDRLGESLCIDQSRVVALGHGAGGHLAAAVACAQPSRFAALVQVQGPLVPSSCTTADGLSVLSISAPGDDVYPPKGGEGPGMNAALGGAAARRWAGAVYDVAPVDDALAAWRRLLSCEAPSERDPIGASLVAVATGCAEGGEVWDVRVGGGHAWPEAANGVIEAFLDGRQRVIGTAGR